MVHSSNSYCIKNVTLFKNIIYNIFMCYPVGSLPNGSITIQLHNDHDINRGTAIGKDNITSHSKLGECSHTNKYIIYTVPVYICIHVEYCIGSFVKYSYFSLCIKCPVEQYLVVATSWASSRGKLNFTVLHNIQWHRHMPTILWCDLVPADVLYSVCCIFNTWRRWHAKVIR